MKYVYLTNGTADFLQKLIQKYKTEDFVLLIGSGHSLLFHETAGKSVFQMPRKYEILEKTGTFPAKGYALFHYIPVRHEDRPVFEYKIMKRPHKLEYAPGFLALYVLRPIKNDHYLIITCWKNKKSVELWKEKEKFLVPEEKDRSIEVNKQKMYMGPSYFKEYYMGKEE